MSDKRTYVTIDLKSFYASVECVVRGLDPLNTNLVVADKSRTNKTICLAVSPSLKSFGIPGRPRLYEVEQKVKQLNRDRLKRSGLNKFRARTARLDKLVNDDSLMIDYVVATPRMGLYIEYSTRIYDIYLKYVSKEDIHIYSIDEVFIDATKYLKTYKKNGHDFTRMIISDILATTGVTATGGIGDNLYLAKVAMDIVAKHLPADKDGVRIAELNERSYREKLWSHEPITDFWRVGNGIARRLLKYNMHTMGDIARFSLRSDGVLYDEFGINAELLIDHAWGYEACNMEDIKAYKPVNNSLSSGQVLHEPYTFDKAKIVCKEMIDNLCLDMVEKGIVTDSVGLYIGYDTSNDLSKYKGKVVMDYYGRKTPSPAGGSLRLKDYTASEKIIKKAIIAIFDETVDKNLLIRRINISANHIVLKESIKDEIKIEQVDLFSDYEHLEQEKQKEKIELQKEEDLQKAIIDIKRRFGKNSILKGTNYEEGATGKDRNAQIGGHKE